MLIPTRFSPMAQSCLAFALAASVLLGGVAMAQIGPQPPQKRPAPENKITQTLSKIIKGNKEKSEDEAEESTSTPDKPTATPADIKQQQLQQQMQQHAGPAHEPLLSQPPLTNAKIEPPQVDGENPPVLSHPKLDDPSNPLGFADAENKLKRLITLIDAKRYLEAKPGLIQIRQSLVDLTEAHIGLYKTLNQLPSAKGQAELEKELALQFAQLRDRAMMELARIYIAEKDYGRAVKELTEVVKSQPKSRVGLRSYEMLQEIGFTEKLQLAQ